MFRSFIAIVFATLSCAAFAGVDVNKASQAELEAVPGMGPALVGRVLDERKKAPFKDWSDLIQRVRGIGEGSAGKLSKGGPDGRQCGIQAGREVTTARDSDLTPHEPLITSIGGAIEDKWDVKTYSRHESLTCRLTSPRAGVIELGRCLRRPTPPSPAPSH